MNSKLYIFLLPLITLLATSCWSAKVSTEKVVEIDNQEIGLQKWQSSSDSWWRLAIDDSIAWRRRIIERNYNDDQQLVSETITEEAIDHRHQEDAEAVEADDEEGEAAFVSKTKEKEKTKIKATSRGRPMLVALGLVIIAILYYFSKRS